MSNTNGSSSPDMDPKAGRQLHQPPRQPAHSKIMSSSTGGVQGSAISDHGPTGNAGKTALLKGGSYPLERHLRALDDPINARMNDPRRWKGQSFTSTPPGISRPYFPKIVGGSSSDQDTVSEQDMLLAEVGATLKG